jgi:putative flippase GtrA
MASGLTERLRGLVNVFWREAAKFGVVGLIAFVIDLGGFNLLFYGPLEGRLATSRLISGAVATTVAWIGNRLWTFRHRQKRAAHHEALLFFVVNGLGLLVSTGYLNATHDWLHMTSRLAVNVNTIIGIAIATLMRFWAYRKFVFVGENLGDQESTAPTSSRDA